MAVTLEFRCPKCGGKDWTEIVSESPGIRFCTGQYQASACGFTWPDYDDWHHFVAILKFRTAGEYNAARQVQQGFQLLGGLAGFKKRT